MEVEEDNRSLYVVSNPLSRSYNDLLSIDNLSLSGTEGGRVSDLDGKTDSDSSLERSNNKRCSLNLSLNDPARECNCEEYLYSKINRLSKSPVNGLSKSPVNGLSDSPVNGLSEPPVNVESDTTEEEALYSEVDKFRTKSEKIVESGTSDEGPIYSLASDFSDNNSDPDECLYSQIVKNPKRKLEKQVSLYSIIRTPGGIEILVTNADDGFNETDSCGHGVVEEIQLDSDLYSAICMPKMENTDLGQTFVDSDLYSEIIKVPKLSRSASNQSMEKLNSDNVQLPSDNCKQDLKVVANGESEKSRNDVTQSPSKQFLACFLGSKVLEEKDLTPALSSNTISECIKFVSNQKPNGSVPCSKLRGLKVILELDDHIFKVIEVQGNVVRQNHPLNTIRVWGIGRDSQSKEFAYVSRDPVLKKHICRVFQCDGLAGNVARMLRDTCANLASDLKKNGNSEKKSPVPVKNQSQNAAPLQNGKTPNKSPPENQTPSNSIDCLYLGMIKLSKPSGNNILDNAINMVFMNVPQDLWVKAETEVSSLSVKIRQEKTVRVDCPVSSITYVGSSSTYKKLGAFIMQKNTKEIYAHVVFSEPSAQIWLESMKTICRLDRSKFDKQKKKKQHLSGIIQSLRGAKKEK